MTNSKKVRGFPLYILISIFAITGYFLFFQSSQNSSVQNKATIVVKFKIEFADTPEKRLKGLSGREELAENAGFVRQNGIKNEDVLEFQ